MNENEQTPEQMPEVQSPLRRVVAIALMACFASLICVYLAARPAVSQLQVWWMEWLVYAVVPVTVTFIILYRSGWHREITGAARTCSMLLFSCLILGGELIAVGVMFCVAIIVIAMIAFGANAVTGGNH